MYFGILSADITFGFRGHLGVRRLTPLQRMIVVCKGREWRTCHMASASNAPPIALSPTFFQVAQDGSVETGRSAQNSVFKD